ncbi:hypothetical protein AJ79_09983 [Helicocarpus griseus UAMH5409]|uniref:Uncharacterized protein n=1 Tax=Helicocarpus griseus UAMH5409 TaxID=1447875 RepID=A0A2B7WG59_9EURO|nr:hypothetical protein AJ79_09983 [Helicocarpus griseus UAMH5409]
MAPSYRIPTHRMRQTHVLPPRPANGPPGEAVPVSSFISLKTFLAIMIATVCIFVLTVYFWKFGSFLRQFSIHKILGGNNKYVRHAKTWHGWVPLDEYEAKRAQRKELYKKFRQKMAWRSAHADYRWVWWDPDGVEIEKHFEEQKAIRWIPRWMKSYEHEQADLILASGATKSHTAYSEKCPSEANAKKSPNLQISRGVSTRVVKARRKVTARRTPISLDGYCDNVIPPGLYDSLSRTFGRNAEYRVAPWMSRSDIFPKRRPQSTSAPRALQRRLRVCVSVSHLPSSRGEVDATSISRVRRKCASEGCQQNEVQIILSSRAQPSSFRSSTSTSKEHTRPLVPKVAMAAEKSLSWKYKSWAAKMQVRHFERTPPNLHGLVGRPGSPLSGILNAMASSGQQSEFSEQYLRTAVQSVSSESLIIGPKGARTSTLSLLAPPKRRGFPDLGTSHNSEVSLDVAPLDGNWDINRSQLPHDKNPANQSDRPCDFNEHNSQLAIMPPSVIDSFPREPLQPVQNKTVSFRLPKSHHKTRAEPWIGPRSKISNSEIRLIDDLDRRLEWLSNEVDPGRKPFHFLLLANHWLNRSTWYVLDPVSRVSAADRRMYGDPRFNRPLPEPKKGAGKTKYPVQHREKIHAPRLDSWRLAMNGARQSSGAREFLKAVELFDGSADEPPDTAIDPASWLLRRPPQGFGMSNKQSNAYYEGMGGWCEKLDDWQNVCRAYRARRVIFEGGGNRRRMKEVARTATRPCRKVIKKWNKAQRPGGKKSKREAPRETRQTMCGSGSIPCRRRNGGVARRQTIADMVASGHSTVSLLNLPANSANEQLTIRSAVTGIDVNRGTEGPIAAHEDQAVLREQTEWDTG